MTKKKKSGEAVSYVVLRPDRKIDYVITLLPDERWEIQSPTKKPIPVKAHWYPGPNQQGIWSMKIKGASLKWLSSEEMAPEEWSRIQPQPRVDGKALSNVYFVRCSPEAAAKRFRDWDAEIPDELAEQLRDNRKPESSKSDDAIKSAQSCLPETVVEIKGLINANPGIMLEAIRAKLGISTTSHVCSLIKEHLEPLGYRCPGSGNKTGYWPPSA